MSFDIGPRIGIEGEREFKRALSDINKDMQVLGSEMRKVTAEFNGNANSIEALQTRQEVLSRQYDKQEEKIKLIRKALENAKATYGENDKAVKNWEVQLNNAQASLAKLDRELQNNKRYLAEAEQSVDGVAESIDEYGKKVKEAEEGSSLLGKIFKAGFFANIASTAVTALISKIKEFASAAFQTADQISRLSGETGISTTELQKLNYIVTALDGSLEGIERAQARLTRAMDEARTGTGKNAEAFEKLGVSVVDANGSLKSSTDTLFEVFDALNRVGSETERDAIAMQLFGRSAMELNPMIKAGADELNRLSKEAEESGAVMKDVYVAALDAAGDQFDLLKIRVKSFVGEVVAANLLFWGIIEDTREQINYFEQIASNTVQNLSEKIHSLVTEYEAAKQAAIDSINAQVGKWEEMDALAVKSVEEVQRALNSQIAWMDQYEINLRKLSERQVEGVDTLVKKLSDGTKESAAILAGLSTATDEEIEKMVWSMQRIERGKDSLSSALADTTTDFALRMNLISGEVANATKNMNVAIHARAAAAETMNGYIQQTLAMIPQLESAYRQAGSAASRAFESGFSGQGMSASPMSGTSSRPVTVVINNSIPLDGRELTRQTREYRIDDDDNAGVNLVR